MCLEREEVRFMQRGTRLRMVRCRLRLVAGGGRFEPNNNEHVTTAGVDCAARSDRRKRDLGR
jgi:hypothetical protein